MNRLRDTPCPDTVAIAQSEAERIIDGRLAELGGKIERGVRLAEIRDTRGPRVTAVLEGPSAELETA
ncbi:hypothetical protein AB0K15_39965 [Amycolatopsis sp. NPDC049253]|uniref:hypothetical protein n=1 Tax=Amycolatopsis sp. NPDC049253 TaxID=3155274 RepID=UPI00342BE3A4